MSFGASTLEHWIEEVAAPVAYGLLRLKPWEFERLTPSEFCAMARYAHVRREEHEDFVARLAAPMINAAALGKTRRQLTVEDLLGRPTQARRRATAAWKRRQMEKRREEQAAAAVVVEE